LQILQFEVIKVFCDILQIIFYDIKFCLQVTRKSHFRLWGGVLGFIERISVKCIRTSRK